MSNNPAHLLFCPHAASKVLTYREYAARFFLACEQNAGDLNSYDHDKRQR